MCPYYLVPQPHINAVVLVRTIHICPFLINRKKLRGLPYLVFKEQSHLTHRIYFSLSGLFGEEKAPHGAYCCHRSAREILNCQVLFFTIQITIYYILKGLSIDIKKKVKFPVFRTDIRQRGAIMPEDIIEVHLEGKSAQARQVELPKNEGRKCLYFDEVSCSYPSNKFFFCKNCPRSFSSQFRTSFETDGRYVNAMAGMICFIEILILQSQNILSILGNIFSKLPP